MESPEPAVRMLVENGRGLVKAVGVHIEVLRLLWREGRVLDEALDFQQTP
jgi:hypothetical protein